MEMFGILLGDPSFWVAVAFCVFVSLAIRPLMARMKKSIALYRAGIQEKLELAQKKVDQQRLFFAQMEEDTMRIQHLIEEIEANTVHQIDFFQEKFKRDSDRMVQQNSEVRHYYENAFVSDLKKEVRTFILTHLTKKMSDILMHQPLGLPPYFLKKVQTSFQEREARMR